MSIKSKRTDVLAILELFSFFINVYAINIPYILWPYMGGKEKLEII